MKSIQVKDLKNKSIIYNSIEIDCIDGATKEETQDIYNRLYDVLDELTLAECVSDIDVGYIEHQLTNNKDISIYFDINNIDVSSELLRDLI